MNASLWPATGFFVFTLTAFAIGAVGMYAGSRRVGASVRRERWIKLATYFVVIHVMLAVIALGSLPFAVMSVVIAAVAGLELHRLRYPTTAVRVVVGAGFWLCAAGTILFAFRERSVRAMFVFLVVALFDGFSQVIGQLLGRHQLAPRVSPAKTVEGTVGGALAAVVGASLLSGAGELSASRALGLATLLIPAALTGDLLASWVKRSTGVKDFGGMLPGHGGVLDRFDSFLVAAPIALLALGVA